LSGFVDGEPLFQRRAELHRLGFPIEIYQQSRWSEHPLRIPDHLCWDGKIVEINSEENEVGAFLAGDDLLSRSHFRGKLRQSSFRRMLPEPLDGTLIDIDCNYFSFRPYHPRCGDGEVRVPASQVNEYHARYKADPGKDILWVLPFLSLWVVCRELPVCHTVSLIRFI
jgi:hypothetical protein